MQIHISLGNINSTVETLYSTIYYSKYFMELNFDKSTQYVALWTHKRHPIPRPFGRAMECLLWVFHWNWPCYKGFLLYNVFCFWEWISRTCVLSIWGMVLTHWGLAMHICVSKIISTGLDNGLSPGQRQAIMWTNVKILLIGTLGINFS